jgi:hypothetical protein
MPDINGIDGEVLQRLTRLETKMDMIISVKDTAHEALQSTRSAHKRIDNVEADIEAKIELIRNGATSDIQALDKKMVRFMDKVDKIIFWGATTVIGGLIVGAIGLLFSLIQK